jgi:hypothetical protein
MNVISYTDKDLQTLYNKYRMSSYYPNETMKSNQHQPQYTPIGGHNLLLSSSVNANNNNINNPLNNKSEYLSSIKPIPNIRERNRQKLLHEGDKLFDDLELYGLILTNDLLKIRRLQQKINKSDFSLEFNSFRKRLYVNIDFTGEKMVNSIKNISSEFESINGSILSYFKRVLNRNTEFSSKLEFPLNNLKESANNKVTKLNTLFKQRADQLKTLKYFLYPPKIETRIEIPEELKIDWDRRYERLKHLMAYRKLNNDLQLKLKYQKDRMDMMNKAALQEERDRNMRYKDGEKKRKENQINFLKEQEERELEMMNEIEKFQKELDNEEFKQNNENNNLGSIINNNNSNDNAKSKNNKEGKGKKEDESDDDNDEEDEEKDDVDEKEYEFTNKNTIKYPKSERKSDISSIPAPSSLMNKSKK